MPKRTDIKSILIIGAGPIVIGQACEFDYSGTQACKALREEGYRVVLVNSNPATVMTDPEFSDATYIEPITPEFVAKVIAKERPDAVLATMGGQTALNTAIALEKDGTLEKYDVELIGADSAVIEKAEDRLKFRDAMQDIGLSTPRSAVVNSLNDAQKVIEDIGLPVICRPSFTLGGQGGGIAYNQQEFIDLVSSGLHASPINEVLLEESVIGWKEFEMEVVRDQADNCIIVCSIENIDPMGIHTGDSMTVAPALTLTDKEYQRMRNASIAVLREIGVDTGGSNVQFAIDPKTGRMVVIEMNPRVSRSSALASKATGFPIAKIAAKLAVGYTLDELKNDITETAPAAFEPTIDYIVTKIPRFAFEKFPGASPMLTTSMKSVGEAMSFGRNFKESLQKALRSLETDLTGLNAPDDTERTPKEWSAKLGQPTPDRLLSVAEALRAGLDVDAIYEATHIDPWFLHQIEELVRSEQTLVKDGLPETRAALLEYKRDGFSDARMAELAGCSEEDVFKLRKTHKVFPSYKRVDSCAGEFRSLTPYMYATYEGAQTGTEESCEADVTDREKVIILGGGPNRIGQGIEFDYCCVHAVYALKEAGYETIMINCNPETVSTDYDTADRLYFDPLDAEHVLDICRTEQQRGTLKGVIPQLGGQTPLKLATILENAGIPILGTSPDTIDHAEDRRRFQELLHTLKLQQPRNGLATTAEEALAAANDVGYPLVIRPSYVLGGRAMEIVDREASLRRYIAQAVVVSGDTPVLLDAYLSDAVEVDVDCICDGKNVYIAGILEHIEEAGVHSGDSASSLPPHALSDKILAELKKQTVALALELQVKGLMNVQFAIQGDDIYVLEVNPRASRTVPFVAKGTGVAVAKAAARVMAGESLTDLGLTDTPTLEHIAIKVPKFVFDRFPGADVILGPEMKSTGEVMGIAQTFSDAFAKGLLGAGMKLPTSGTVFISVKDGDKPVSLKAARLLKELGFQIMATGGTGRFLLENGIEVDFVNKVLQGRPNIVDSMVNGNVDLVFNTTRGERSIADSFSIRQTALMRGIPNFTDASGFVAVAQAIEAVQKGQLDVQSLQDYFKETPQRLKQAC